MRNVEVNIPFFQVPNSIFDLGLDLSISEKLVYLYLYRLGNNGSDIFPSYRDIAKKCSMSRPTAISAIEGLVRKGFVQKMARKDLRGGDSSNYYLVNNPEDLIISGVISLPQKGKAESSGKETLHGGSKTQTASDSNFLLPAVNNHDPYKELYNKQLNYKELTTKTPKGEPVSPDGELIKEKVEIPSKLNNQIEEIPSKLNNQIEEIPSSLVNLIQQSGTESEISLIKPKKQKGWRGKVGSGKFDKLTARDVYDAFCDMYLEKYRLKYSSPPADIPKTLAIIKASFLNIYGGARAIELLVELFENYESVATEKYPRPEITTLSQAWVFQKLGQNAYNKVVSKNKEQPINPNHLTEEQLIRLQYFGLTKVKIDYLTSSGLLGDHLLRDLIYGDGETMDAAYRELWKEIMPKCPV